MHHANMSTETHASLQACIAACTKCHDTCLHMAMQHCLDAGGKNVEPAHFRLMMNCSEICQVSSNLLMSGSAFSQQQCGICADICDACAKSCEQVGGMDDCVKACRACAESCRKMASAKL